MTDAQVVDAVRDIAWTTEVDRDGVPVRKLAPEGLYGRRKMTALAASHSDCPRRSAGAVDRAMRTLGLSGVRRDKGIRTTIPAKDGKRAGDLLDRDFTAPAPNRAWVTDFTYVRTWAGFVYVAFIVDVFAQRIVAWHAATTKHTDLVMTPLRMALWQRDREGRPVDGRRADPSLRRRSRSTPSMRLTEHLALEEHPALDRTVGDAYDNALMETINGLYKAECIRTTVFHDGPYKTIADVEYATAGWVDWYNNRRLHGDPWQCPPSRVRAAHYADPQPRAATRIGAAENLGRFTIRPDGRNQRQVTQPPVPEYSPAWSY